jgi:hypothetical protein
MIRRVLVLMLLTLTLGVACGGDDDEEAEQEAAGQACLAAPAALSGEPGLPADFPQPDEVTYTSTEDAGPSTVVKGYWDGELEDAYEGYKDAFEEAGYDVTKDEQEEFDAEVNFAGGGTDGQVKLEVECEARTSVTITARPE